MYFDLFSRRWVFAPDGVPSGGAEAPSETPAQPVAATPAPATNEQQTFSADYVKSLREEAKETRLQNKQLSTELEKLRTAAGSNAELTAKIDEMASNLAKAQADADAATQRAELVRLAAKANVPIEVADLLDVSKLDLTDEKKALEQLGKLAIKPTTGSQVKPGNNGDQGLTDAQLREEIYGGRRMDFWGGKR